MNELIKNIPTFMCHLAFVDDKRKVVIDNILFSYIDKSNVHGFGLFSSEDIKCGTILGSLDGQIMDWNNYDELSDYLKNILGKYKNYFLMEWNALNTKTLLVRPFRTKYSYINHSSKPNVEIKYNPIRIETIKNIKKCEELFLDYDKEPLKEDYLNGHGKTFL